MSKGMLVLGHSGHCCEGVSAVLPTRTPQVYGVDVVQDGPSHPGLARLQDKHALTPSQEQAAQPSCILCLLSPRVKLLCAGWFSLNVPSGLTLYWFTNNLLSTGQQVCTLTLKVHCYLQPLPHCLTWPVAFASRPWQLQTRWFFPARTCTCA